MSFSNNINVASEKSGKLSPQGKTSKETGGGFKPLHAPFAWVGGKSKLAAQIIPLMAPHQKYIEVFGGAF